MSVLPNQIPPIGTPLLDARGNLSDTWWLFWYNIAQQTLGSQGTTAAAQAAQLLANIDSDSVEADISRLHDSLAQLTAQIRLPDPPTGNSPVMQLWGTDSPHQASAPVSVTVGASPFTYIAPFNGIVLIEGGTVSGTQIQRSGTSLAISGNVVPVARLDSVVVTYSAAPTMSFLGN